MTREREFSQSRFLLQYVSTESVDRRHRYSIENRPDDPDPSPDLWVHSLTEYSEVLDRLLDARLACMRAGVPDAVVRLAWKFIADLEADRIAEDLRPRNMPAELR